MRNTKASTQNHRNHLLLMAHTHCTGPGQGPENDGFLYYAMYGTHYTGTGTWNLCFLLYPSHSLSRAVYD